MNRVEERSHSILKRVAKGAGKLFIGKSVSVIIGFFTGVLLSRLMGPNKYGILSVMLAVVSIAYLLTDFGLGQALVYYVPRLMHKKKKRRLRALLNFCFGLRGITALVVSLLFLTLAEPISLVFFRSTELSPFVRIFAVCLFFFSLLQLFPFVFQAFQRLEFRMYQDISLSISGILPLILFILGFGLIGTGIGFLLMYILTSFIFLLLIIKKFYPKVKPRKINRSAIIKFSSLFFISAVLITLSSQFMVPLLAYFKSPVEASYFTISYFLAGAMLFFPLGLGNAFFPAVSELHESKDEKSLRSVFKKITKYAVFTAMPVAITFIFLGREVIDVVYGSSYLLADSTLKVVAIAYLISACYVSILNLAYGLGKIRIIIKANLFSLIVSFILCIILIPKFGSFGAGVALIFAQIITGFLIGLMISKHFPVNYPFFSVIKSAILCILTLVPLYLISNFVGGYLKLVIWLIFGSTIYFCLLYLLNEVEEQEKKLISSLFKSVKNVFG